MTVHGVIQNAPQPTTVDFRDIFEQHSDYVLRTLRFLGVDRSDLEDVSHDIFLHVYRHFGSYDPTRPFRPWLYAFIYRTARDFRKLMRHRETATDNFAHHEDASPHPDVLVQRQQLQQLALRALDVLEPDERAVFVATTLDELTAPEISVALQIPLNTVYSRLRRAKSKFEAQAQQLYANERHQ